MIAALILFGLRLAPLYRAIAQVESDRGTTSANVYQVRTIYIEDVNRVTGLNYTIRDKADKDKAEMMMYHYWRYWGAYYKRKTGLNPTYEVLARMHNGGGENGWRKQSTKRYWLRVRKEMGK